MENQDYEKTSCVYSSSCLNVDEAYRSGYDDGVKYMQEKIKKLLDNYGYMNEYLKENE